nr:receptor-like protein kinase HSL1 [Tanacetum cinerariifolium]
MNMLFSQSLCLVFLMFLIPLSSYGLNQEAGYLQKMKLGFDDPDGFFKSWTGDDDSPCSWTGVTCSEPGSTGSVVSVDLSNANIAGPFPVSLPELTELKVLDLTGNNFSGDIPASYGQFQSLEVISLVDNLISGKIPAVVGNITTLKQLNLSYNPFTAGEIPAEIGKLKNLEVLWLTGCNLIGPIPDSLSQLGQLVDLDLAINKLSGSIPRSLTELKKVVQIELYNNSLTGELPKMGWSKMTSLRLLDFSMNLLTGNVPEELCSLQLESLNLYENEFADVYLGHVFSDNVANVWNELEETYDRVDEARTELIDHGKLLKLMQFLMGLDDVYQPIGSSLLKGKSFLKSKMLWTNDNNMQRNITNWTNNNGSNMNTGNYDSLLSKNYGLKGHTDDTCFEMIGYPPDFKRNSNLKPASNFNNNKGNNADAKGGFVGDSDLKTSTGANQHMTSSTKNMINLVDISDLKLTVGHPNGTLAKTIHVGANQHMTSSTKNMINLVDISDLKLTVGHPNGTLAKTIHV